MLFLQYLWYALMDFHQTFVGSASWDRDEPVRFWGQKVKDQNLSMARGQAGWTNEHGR